MTTKKEINEQAANDVLRDVVWLLGGTRENRAIENYRDPEVELPGLLTYELLTRSFSLIDSDGNGISRAELAKALVEPARFSVEDYTMMRLIAKYFDTLINLSDDEDGEETLITKADVEVLGQFLLNSDLKMSELHQWIVNANGKATEQDIGPPPISG